jgi:signal peptide peptidase SppA
MTWAMRPQDLDALVSKLRIDEERLLAVLDRKGTLLQRIAQHEALNEQRSAATVAGVVVVDGVAHIPVSGPMMKQVPCIFDLLGIEACSTEVAREQLAAALCDPGVDSIQLDIDSPGGTVGGTAALANDIAAVRGEKPIIAHVPDMACSAALWVASQADRIVAGEAAVIGSIGVYSVIDDVSAAYAKKGIKTNVISSHPLKGIGVEGSEVTDEQLADVRREINEISDVFVSAVAKGRGMAAADVQKLATGQVWIGAIAMELGLVDKIETAGATSPSVERQTTEIAMDPKETQATVADAAKLEALEKENAELRAKSVAADALVQSAKATRRNELMEKYAGSIPPNAIDAVEQVGIAMDDNERFENEYLKKLPPVTNAVRQSVAPDITTAISDVEIMTPEQEKQMTKFFGRAPRSLKQQRRAAIIGDKITSVQVFSDTVTLADGEVVHKDDLESNLGLN